MTAYRPLGVDANGVVEEFGFDEVTQEIILKRTHKAFEWDQLRHNQDLQNDNYTGYSPDKTFQHVASIPMVVIEQWVTEYGVDPTEKGNETLLTRLLNDPDYRWLRTSTGRVRIKES